MILMLSLNTITFIIHYIMNAPKIFVTSDTHFFHRNIIKYCNRPFNNVEEMNNTMISNWNKVVGKNDIVIHCGDFCLSCNNTMLHNLRRQLNGTILLITGNHDHPTRLRNFNIIVLTAIDKEESYVVFDNLVFSHRPLTNVPHGCINIFGHIHNKSAFGKRINVSVDACDFTPVALNTLREQAKVILHG